MAETSKQLLEEIHESWEKEKELYAMYLRKSRADLELEAMGEEETLARHKSMLYKLAEKHGIRHDQIVIYHELVSGDSIDERPEMQRLLEDVFTKKYKGVLCVEVERLARGNTKDQGEVAEAFQYSHTHIITPSKVYDPDNEFDQEYFEFGLFMSRREYKTIRRRMENGKKESVEEGNYILPKPPFGFNVVRTSKKDRFLVENPDESQYVKMIFNWYVEDRKPTYWIARQLQDMGVPTKRGGEWSRSTITAILFNVCYIGYVTWGHQKTVKVKDPITGKTKKKCVKSKDDQKIFKGKHKGFISEEQFNKVNEIYGTNAKVKGKFELSNALSGIIVCKKCGRSIQLQRFSNTRDERFYHPYIRKCKAKSLKSSEVVEAIIESLKAYIEDFTVRMENDASATEEQRHLEMIAAMEKELVQQNKRKRRLMDEWDADDCVYTREEFIERKQMYTHTIETLEAKISEAKKTVPKKVDYSERITTIHALIDCLRDNEIPAKEKNVFLKQYIEKITYDVEDYGRRKGGKALLDVYLK